MKNKIIISFFINLLVGILFSFPVFSAHTDIQASSLSVVECQIAENDLNFNTDPSINGNTKIGFPKEDLTNASKNKIVKKTILPGNKGSSQYISSPFFVNFVFINLTTSNSNLNSTFVNISFLKELRTIKMLC